jgi:hypothetical protein
MYLASRCHIATKPQGGFRSVLSETSKLGTLHTAQGGLLFQNLRSGVPFFIFIFKPFLFAFQAFCPCAILNHQAGRRSDNGSFRCCFSIMLPINSTSFTNSHHSHMNPSPLVSCVYDQVSLLLLHPKSILYDLLDQVLCFSQLPHLWMPANLSCFKGWNCLEMYPFQLYHTHVRKVK